MIKQRLIGVARKMSTLPIVGRVVRIVVGVIRLPELRIAYQASSNRQRVFETEQLPTLLRTISELNHRQLTSDNDRDNLVKSVPLALRKITRDQIGVREELEKISVSLDQRLNETREKIDSVTSLVDLRQSETRDQIVNLSNSTNYLFGRVEFVRRELMFEMRYGAKSPNSQTEQISAKVEIINPEKLANARSNKLRLNLGCGHITITEYLNVDRRALPGVDIVSEVNQLPFEAEEVDEIFSAHLLEHFPQEQLRRELLPYYFGLLKEGGIFRAVVPDAEAMIQEYTKGIYPYEYMREVMFGAQDYDGDFHFNMFTPASLSALLEEAGFIEIQIIEDRRRNGACFEFEIVAKRTKSEWI